MSDEKKALIKARLKEIESIAESLRELLDNEDHGAKTEDNSTPENPPPVVP